MSNFEVTIPNLPKLERMFRDFPEIAGPTLQKALTGTQFVFQKNTLKNDPVPWRTGNLLTSFRFRSTRDEARWYPTANYAHFVEFGTRPHTIRPRNARVLSWEGGGQRGYVTAASGRRYYKSSPGTRSFAMVVNHPGSKPKPYMKKIVEKSTQGVTNLFQEAGDIIVREMASRAQEGTLF